MTDRLKKVSGWAPLPLALVAFLAVAPFTVHAAEDDEDDPTEASASVVQLDAPEQPVDVQAPASQFIVPNGEEIWKRAWTRVTTPVPGQGAGRFSLSDMLGSDIFKVAKNLRFEMFSPDETGADLQVVISAEEATQEGQSIKLKNMRMVFFMNEKVLQAQKKKSTHSNPKKETNPKKEPAPEKPSFMPMGGRVEISAPHALVDVASNEGRATGEVKIQIFQKAKQGQVERPVAVLSTERLNWRMWSEATTGANEIAVYTAREGNETKDPLVQGYYEVEQPGQPPATMRLQGRGMVFESGTLDHVAPIYDDDGRLAGGSRISRNRAIFRSAISIEMNASSLSAFMPFQMASAQSSKTKAAPKPEEVTAPSRTLVACNGPAILDMAVVPYTKRNPDANLAQPATAPVTKEQLLPVLLARRFEFLNNVTMLKVPLDAAGQPVNASADGETRMSCGNLRIQLPAVQPQGGFGMAEYVEAIGGVKMKGRNTAGNITGAGAPGPAQDFAMNCERMYFDGPTGSMFLVGSPKNPASALNPQFEASALQFSYQMKTQDFAMPLKGPKRMVIRGGAPAKSGGKVEKKDDSMLNFSQGDTIITWNGPLLRKLVRLPVPGGADRIKEVLTFTDNVAIEQSTGGLSMKAGHVKVVRPSPEGAVEYLEGIGGVDVKMGDQMIRGEKVAVEMLPGPNGKLSKDTITISGSRKKQLLATLIKGGSAARAEKFVIDRTTDTFMSLGGTVAVVKREGGEKEAPKPQAAVDAGGLFQGINLQQGGNLFIQSDGEFVKDGATNTIRIKKNVIVRQPGLELLADEVELQMDSAPGAATTGAPASGELFTADPKKIRCIGNIEVIAGESQWVQADELEYDVATQRSTLKMTDPQNDVRIYMRDEGGGTRVLCVRGSLELDGKSGTFKPNGQMMMLPFKKAAPSSRAPEDSPARGKAQKK